MAHVIFATRGVNHEVELFKLFMQTQMFPWKRTNITTGKEETALVQGALRPIQLWEYVVPEEHLNEVCTMLDFDENGKIHPFPLPIGATILRKAMGAEKVKYTKVPTGRYIHRPGVAIYPIGIKRDEKQSWQEIGYKQEML